MQNILCIRTDNMGDLLMSIPAIRSLKETFHCKITVLVSPNVEEISRQIDCIDRIIVFNSPWNREKVPSEEVAETIQVLKAHKFDAAFIFTVYSQNPLPAAFLAFLADIPIRIAYCRETPYQLLTHWIPDKEPYFKIKHQVLRDLKLVKTFGAKITDTKIKLQYAPKAWKQAVKKVYSITGETDKPWIILHAGVSEDKRTYPLQDWIETGRRLIEKFNFQLFFTGSSAQSNLLNKIVGKIGTGAFAFPGILNIEELTALIDHSRLIISVNTVVTHIAAAMDTPLIVLYALTNPQHTPWKAKSKILYFHPPKEIQSRNEVVRYVYEKKLKKIPYNASPTNIIRAVAAIFNTAPTKEG